MSITHQPFSILSKVSAQKYSCIGVWIKKYIDQYLEEGGIFTKNLLNCFIQILNCFCFDHIHLQVKKSKPFGNWFVSPLGESMSNHGVKYQKIGFEIVTKKVESI